MTYFHPYADLPRPAPKGPFLMYSKIKREIVLWLALIAGVIVAIADTIEGPPWFTAVKVAAVAVLAWIARNRVTPVFDPRDNNGNPLEPKD